ncbi:hypothetical protein [Halosimplex marinum]
MYEHRDNDPSLDPDDADAGEYTYSVRATPHDDDPEAVEREFTFTVAAD